MRGILYSTLAIIAGSCMWNCSTESGKPGDVNRFIPSSTQRVIKISDPSQLAADLGRNELSAALDQEPSVGRFRQNEVFFTQLYPHTELFMLSERFGKGTGEIVMIAPPDSKSLPLDSINGLQLDRIKDKAFAANRLIIGSDTLFNTTLDSVMLLSPKADKLSSIVDHARMGQTPVFWKKAFDHQSRNNLVVYDRQPQVALRDSSIVPLGDIRMLEFEITASRLNINGFAQAQDSSISLVNVFRGQQPQSSTLFEVMPINTIRANSFTYRDATLLFHNLSTLRKDSLSGPYPLLFDTLLEVGQLELAEGRVVVVRSLDPQLTSEQLEPLLNRAERYRDVQLYDFNRPGLFENWFSPLLDLNLASTMFRLGDHFFFAQNSATSEALITSIQNNAVLAKSPLYQNSQEDILNTISAQFVYLQDRVTQGMYQAMGYSIERAPLKKTGEYELGVFQMVHEKNFCHLNFTARESTGSKELSSGLSQLATIKLDAPIMSEVQLFSNHRTSGKDIVLQDINNDLSLFSSSGKRLWKKPLDAPILGRVKEVDLLRNGKKQLAFVTSGKLYVIDRNGKDVAPFPVNFKDPVTQPLSVFDYDNNRNYRFVIVQGKEILLYDSRARVVDGFRFRRAGSEIVLPPQHIRIGSKDYVIIAEANGRLNILSRVGRTRVELEQRLDFSGNAVAKEGDDFVVITADNKKVTIDQNGKLSSRTLDVGPDFFFDIMNRVKVTLDENLLRINGKLIELPFGVYSKPRLFESGSRVLIGLTETQEKKVYLFDSRGELMPGLPAFGTSPPDYGRSRAEGNLMVVTGGDQEVLLYRIEK